MHQRAEQEIMKNWEGDTAKPIVSICCTTYNHEPYIAEAIEGFLTQETDFPFEILIRDDCSTDKTAEIVRKYSDKYPTLIKPVYEKENTFSKGIRPMPQLYKIAKGLYIATCEGDDYWTDPLKLQKQVVFLEENIEYSLCYTAATLIDDSGVILNPNKQFGDSSRDELISGLGNAITGSVMFRKFDFRDYLTLDVKNGDSLLWHFLGFYGKCKQLKNINNTVYRIHDGGIWSGRSLVSRLSESVKTYNVIRNRIINRLGIDSPVLEKHDTVYISIFVNYFVENFKNKNFKNCIFGVKKLNELEFISNKDILYILLKGTINIIKEVVK